MLKTNKVKCETTGTIFNVEKVKNNTIPVHFFAAEKKQMKIGRKKVNVMMNKDRTQYVAFQMDTQAYYVRDHKFFESNKVSEYVKPKTEKKASKKTTKKKVTNDSTK